MHEDPHPARVDGLKYDTMQKINDLVNCVLRFAVKNPKSDIKDYVREVMEKIEDVAEGRVGPHEYAQIAVHLRSLVDFVRAKPDEDESNEPYALSITNHIIDTIQGDTQMSRSTTSAMIFRRVKEAVAWGAVSGGGGSDERIDEVVEDCANRIMSDVFGGKTPAELRASEFVSCYYEMDPETEDLLDNGTLVINGMKVLIEDDKLRVDPSANMMVSTRGRALKTNRWCVVQSARIVTEKDDQYLSFIGLYDDGTKRKWYLPARVAWFVKKDTIPRVDGIYNISDEAVQFTGIPDQVVDALRSLPVSSWEKYLVHVGGDGFETVSQYLWRVERTESEDPTELERYKTIADKNGNYIATGKSDALLRAYIERYIEPVNFSEYRVNLPGGTESITLMEYLGVNDELAVWNGEGMQLFKGTREEIRTWADSPDGGNKRYLGLEVARDGRVGGVTLRDFMQGRTE